MTDLIEHEKYTNKLEEIASLIKWTHEHENILIDWADKAMCYRWLHSKSYERYNLLNTWFTIPVIVMSTLTGTANFAQERVPLDYRGYFSMIVGGVNIAAGIITTIQNFLKISQLNEAHRVGSLSWDKFYRKIRVELAKSPDERQGVEVYLKSCNEEFDRLMETSPPIEHKIVKIFKFTFEGSPKFDLSGNQIITEKQRIFKEIKKPEICDDIESVRKSVYTKVENTKLVSSDFSMGMSDVIKRKRNLDLKEKKITEFTESFFEKYNRQPTEEEIIENLENEKENMNKVVIGNWINRNKQLNASKLNIGAVNLQNIKIESKPPIIKGDDNV
ncbi:MAG: SLATT domain-containing protein [Candidatus Paceibacterota bacterium]